MRTQKRLLVSGGVALIVGPAIGAGARSEDSDKPARALSAARAEVERIRADARSEVGRARETARSEIEADEEEARGCGGGQAASPAPSTVKIDDLRKDGTLWDRLTPDLKDELADLCKRKVGDQPAE